MDMSSDAAMRDQLEMQIGEVMRRSDVGLRVLSPAVSCDGLPQAMAAPDDGREPFGTWLRNQHNREDEIVYLAQAARSDPNFPRRGTVARVRAHLQQQRAPWEAFEQLEMAEAAWDAGEC